MPSISDVRCDKMRRNRGRIWLSSALVAHRDLTRIRILASNAETYMHKSRLCRLYKRVSMEQMTFQLENSQKGF